MKLFESLCKPFETYLRRRPVTARCPGPASSPRMGDLRAKALLVALLACGVGLFYVLEVRPPFGLFYYPAFAL